MHTLSGIFQSEENFDVVLKQLVATAVAAQACREGGETGVPAPPLGCGLRSASWVHLLWTNGTNENLKTKLPARID